MTSEVNILKIAKLKIKKAYRAGYNKGYSDAKMNKERDDSK